MTNGSDIIEFEQENRESLLDEFCLSFNRKIERKSGHITSADAERRIECSAWWQDKWNEFVQQQYSERGAE